MELPEHAIRWLQAASKTATHSCWKFSYRWRIGRVRFEKHIGEAFELDGKLTFVDLKPTGESFTVLIPVFWWCRLRYRFQAWRDGKVPKARALKG